MSQVALKPADGSDPPSTDIPAGGLSSEEATRRLQQYGPNAIHEHRVHPLIKLLRYFWGPIPWMIEIAAILSGAVGHWDDLALILALLVVNGVIGFWEEHKASNALDALKSQLALKARARRDGRWREVAACELVPGDIIRLRLGDIIPADVMLTEGDYLRVDQSALTGESLPVDKKAGDEAYSGTIAKQGEMVAEVTATGAHTFFGRTAKLVESAGSASHFQQAVMRIGNFLIAIAVVLSMVLIGVELARGSHLLHVVQFVLILVIASIPVAMPAVLSVTMALGAKALSKHKAIVTRLQSIEEMAGIDILCSDKTGTLTQNQLTLGEPVLFGAQDPAELNLAAALASKAENNDAIDLAVIAALPDAALLDSYRELKFTPFDPVSKRTEAHVESDNGDFYTTKGAPQVILDLCGMQGEQRVRADKAVTGFAERGFRTLGVARTTQDATWRFLGILSLYDPPREDSESTIREAREHGIEVKMVTGDHIAIAREISGGLGMGRDILPPDRLPDDHMAKADTALIRDLERADGFAQVFPEHKYAIVKALQEGGHIVGMTGDGVNDAPALKQADVGIAVSGATDAARAAASLVLTAPGLSTIVHAVEEARRIFGRMMSYTIYRIAMTIDIMVFVVLAMLITRSYPLTAILIILLALLDDIPIMTIAYDHTWLEPKPVRWQMKRVLTVSSVLGLVAVAETFLMMVIGRRMLGMGGPELQTLMFLQLVAGGNLMLFVTRSKQSFWRAPHPSWQLLAATIGTQIVAAGMAWAGWLMAAIPAEVVGLVWAYNVAWMVLQDAVKLGLYRVLPGTDAGTVSEQARTDAAQQHV
ncbi:MAG: plasma-membrane proton-efflux P-type ATPase [Chromatiales bacterium 21-64-14]|nr:MAG: plasma-membrane proton-efflux P-type ATPase [Chromatiales bacterium 21-64-14]HQU16715.1 plasma-membrane proton-efflux P-type ATPase [Gammaproteobacteria bacterium]